MASRTPDIELHPPVLRWARERANLGISALAAKLKTPESAVLQWEQDGKISMAKANALAKRTHTPIGYLYRPSVPEESLPITDFRTRSGVPPRRASPELLETVYRMQRRQMWMADELRQQSADPLPFVGAHDLDSSPQTVAAAMHDVLKLSGGWQSVEGTWTSALATLRHLIEGSGILLVFNGVIGNDTSRPLDPDEFQGFALVDDYAPLIFINNVDYKTAQIFSLAHELAHIFIGEQGLSRLEQLHASDHRVERVCDQIAAEFLVPKHSFDDAWAKAKGEHDPYQHLAKRYKVSTLVIARRALDSGVIQWEEFSAYFEEKKALDWGGNPPVKGGGNFWNKQYTRIGRPFAMAIVHALGEGRLTYTDAYRLTGLSGKSFDNMAQNMRLPV